MRQIKSLTKLVFHRPFRPACSTFVPMPDGRRKSATSILPAPRRPASARLLAGNAELTALARAAYPTIRANFLNLALDSTSGALHFGGRQPKEVTLTKLLSDPETSH
jgi:hypothetical protein